MDYLDPIYGATTITEPVLHDLLAAPAVLRLHHILQHGVTALLDITRRTTRFEHSVGVMLLVARLGGSVQEQIAALLHDISHTAFSHVVDHVFDDAGGQSFHDRQKEAYLRQTDIPQRLARHGYDWRACLDETAFPLLEQPAPALCGDRVDYFLRDAFDLGLLTATEIDHILAHLTTVAGRMVVTSLTAAQIMGQRYLDADDASWANFREVGLYELTGRAIKRALAAGIFQTADLWGRDADLWQRLHDAPDAELQGWLRLVHPETRFVWDENHPTFHITTKLRTLDPGVLHGDQVYPLSALDVAFAQRRTAYLARKRGPWPMRVIPPPGRVNGATGSA